MKRENILIGGLIIVFIICLALVCIGVGTIVTATESGFRAAADHLEDVFAGQEDGFSIEEANTLRRCFVQQRMILGGITLFIGAEGSMLCLIFSYFALTQWQKKDTVE